MTIISTIVDLGRSQYNTLPVLARNGKIMEELGEFAEALLHKLGFLPHKTMKEPLMGEGADVIICVLDTLSAAHPELTTEEIETQLLEQLALKSAKWSKVMRIRYETVNE